MKKRFLTVIVTALLFYLLRYPKEGLAASKEGMGLWLNTLIPTLLPFLILTDFVIRKGNIETLFRPFRKIWKILLGLSPFGTYAFLVGAFCGYPMGAKVTSDLYAAHRINLREAKYLLAFASCASPVFIRTYLAEICLKNQVSSGLLYGILILSEMMTMLFFRFCIYRNKTDQYPEDSIQKIGTDSKASFAGSKKEAPISSSQGAFLDTSIMNGFETITRLGGYILLFSVLSACIRHYWNVNSLSEYLLLGSVELTTGLYQLASSSLPLAEQCFCAVALTSFGGICVIMQTGSLLHKELPLSIYIEGKLVNTLFTVCLALVLAKII